MEYDILPVRQFVHQNSFDPELNKHLQSLPNAQDLRVKSYKILIVLISCHWILVKISLHSK
jgi:hypothetical protein